MTKKIADTDEPLGDVEVIADFLPAPAKRAAQNGRPQSGSPFSLPMHPIERVPELVRRLYALVAEFEALFPGRAFTPDGHLVGSIGEVIAAHRYRLRLHAASSEGHDAVSTEGKQVEIKATQGSSVGLRSEPEQLIVLHLGSSGEAAEVFNGPGRIAWENCGKVQKNGQRPISLSKLRKLMGEVQQAQRVAAKT